MKQLTNSRKVKFSYQVTQKHWVGDGFYVYGLLRPSDEINKHISPFILMDYASPLAFPKTERPKGVGEHPHRGFETVTFAYQGEVEHRDSSGGGGVIKAGGVQWMTAGRGVVHDEFHSKEFSKNGGIFEMVQLWVNLPRKDKMTTPKYQGIQSEEIPYFHYNENTKFRIIAGDYQCIKGPASTFTPINIYEIQNKNEDTISIKLLPKTNTIVLILRGSLEMEGNIYNEQNVLIFDSLGENIYFKSSKNFKALMLNGLAIDEPMVASGPFVMNTKEEIYQAIKDYQNGQMGKL